MPDNSNKADIFQEPEISKKAVLSLSRGIASASDIFNYLTDGSMRYNGLGCIKNMDDVLL